MKSVNTRKRPGGSGRERYARGRSNHLRHALCPFPMTGYPSLYVTDDHIHCFACGAHGDVIDFVGKLFQLSPMMRRGSWQSDFHLSPDKPPSAAALHAKHIQTEAQQLMENERLCFSVLSDYARVLRDWKVRVRRSYLTSCSRTFVKPAQPRQTEYLLRYSVRRGFPRTRRSRAAADGRRQTGQATTEIRENSQGGIGRWI